MRPVKWERVKLRAQQAAGVRATGYCGWDGDSATMAPVYALMAGVEDGTFNWRTNLTRLQELVWDRIAKWDIRCLRKLHELFPPCLPRDCRYVVEQDDKGEWWVTA